MQNVKLRSRFRPLANRCAPKLPRAGAHRANEHGAAAPAAPPENTRAPSGRRPIGPLQSAVFVERLELQLAFGSSRDVSKQPKGSTTNTAKRILRLKLSGK